MKTADTDGNQGDHEHENTVAVASRHAHFVLPQHGLVVALELANERDDKAVNGRHPEEDAHHPEAEVCNVLQKPRVVDEALGGFVHVVDQGHEGGEEQRADDAEGRVLVQHLALGIAFDGVELVEALDRVYDGPLQHLREGNLPRVRIVHCPHAAVRHIHDCLPKIIFLLMVIETTVRVARHGHRPLPFCSCGWGGDHREIEYPRIRRDSTPRSNRQHQSNKGHPIKESYSS